MPRNDDILSIPRRFETTEISSHYSPLNRPNQNRTVKQNTQFSLEMHSFDRKDSGSNDSREAVDTYTPIGEQETPWVKYFEEQHPFKVLSELETNRSCRRKGQMPPQYGENYQTKRSESLKPKKNTRLAYTIKPKAVPRLPLIPVVHIQHSPKQRDRILSLVNKIKKFQSSVGIDTYAANIKAEEAIPNIKLPQLKGNKEEAMSRT